MTLVAGVDSSTQSVKIVVCDVETGAVLRSARASHPSGTEVSASAWLAAYQEATADPELLDGVSALAVGGQQHGMVTLDEDGELVRDALLWNDNRSAPDAEDLIAELGGPTVWADSVGSVPVASSVLGAPRKPVIPPACCHRSKIAPPFSMSARSCGPGGALKRAANSRMWSISA